MLINYDYYLRHLLIFKNRTEWRKENTKTRRKLVEYRRDELSK